MNEFLALRLGSGAGRHSFIFPVLKTCCSWKGELFPQQKGIRARWEKMENKYAHFKSIVDERELCNQNSQ